MTADIAAARAAADRIYMRRAESHDPDLERLQAVNLLGIVAYAHTCTSVPSWVLRQDAEDSWIILEYFRAAVDTNRFRILRMGREKAGMTWQDLATMIGIRSRQGAEALFLRLRRAVIVHEAKDHEAERASRKWDRELAGWLRLHTRELRELVVKVEAIRDSLSAELHDDVVELLRLVPTGAEVASPVFAARLVAVLADLDDDDLALPPWARATVRNGRALLKSKPVHPDDKKTDL